MKKIGILGDGTVPHLMVRCLNNLGRLIVRADCRLLSGNGQGAEQIVQSGANGVDASKVKLYFPWPKWHQETKHPRNTVVVPREDRLTELARTMYDEWRPANTPDGGGLDQAVRVAAQFGVEPPVADKLRPSGRQLPRGPEYLAPPEVAFDGLGRAKAIMVRNVALALACDELWIWTDPRHPWAGGTRVARKVAAERGIPVADLATGKGLDRVVALEPHLSRWEGQDLFLELCWLSRAGGDWDRACFRDRMGAGVEVFRMGYEALGSADRLRLHRALPHSLFWENEGFTLDLPEGGVLYATEPERRRHDVHLPTVLYPGPKPVTVPDGWSKDPCRMLRHPSTETTARRIDDEDEGAEHVRELRSIVVAHSTGSPKEDWARHVLALPGGARLLSRELVKQPSGLVTMPVAPGPPRDGLDYPIGVMARKLFGGQLFAPSQRKGRDRPALRWLGTQDRQLLFGLRDALHALDLDSQCKLALLRQIYVNVDRESRHSTEPVSVARSVTEASLLDLVALRQVLEPEPAEQRKGLDFEVLAYRLADEGIEDLQCIEEILDEAEAAWERETTDAGESEDRSDEGDEPISGLFDGLTLVDAATLTAPPPADPPLREARHVVVGRWGGEAEGDGWGESVATVVEALRKAETPKAVRDLRPDVEVLRADRKAYWLVRGLWLAHLERAKERRERAVTVRVPAGQAEAWRKLRGRQPPSMEAKLRRAERRRDPVAFVKALQDLHDKEASLHAARRLGVLVNQANGRKLAARIIESKLSANPYGYAMPAKTALAPRRALVLA